VVTAIDHKLEVLLQTPGKVILNGMSILDAVTQVGAFPTSGAVNFG